MEDLRKIESESDHSSWQATLQYNLDKLADDPKAKPDDLFKGSTGKAKDDSKALPPDPYRSLRGYLRDERLYGPFLANIRAKLKIKPSVEKPGSYVKEVAAPPVDVTEAVETMKLDDTTTSVDTTKPVDPPKTTSTTKSNDPFEAVDTTTPASGEGHASRRRRTHHASRSKDKSQDEEPNYHGRRRR